MKDPFTSHGALSWCELMTTDPAGAAKFYGELFGWTGEDAGMGMPYTVLKLGDQGFGGIMEIPPDAPPGMPPHWGVYVTVDDVDATVRKAQQLGGRVLVPPQDIPEVGRFSVLQDPQGAVISVIRYLPR